MSNRIVDGFQGSQPFITDYNKKIIIYNELEKFIIPLNWEFKKFDLKLINKIIRNHPYQKIKFWVYNCYASYVDEYEGDILHEIDYFQLLDRYYRYGITFEDGELYPREFFDLGQSFNNKLYVYERFTKKANIFIY